MDRDTSLRIEELERRIADLEIATPRAPVRDAEANAGGRLAKFKINGTVGGDYLTCKRYDADADKTAGRTILVAKPWELRQSPFNGVQIEYPDGLKISYIYANQRKRSATSSTGLVENQAMIPDYFQGAIILAARGIAGGTGAEGPASEVIIWEDLNTTGRFWAKTG